MFSELWRGWTRHTFKLARARIPGSVRDAVLSRDGWRCRDCGARANLCLDHVWPWIMGGSDDPSNLAARCWRCNQAKSDRLPFWPLACRVVRGGLACICIGVLVGLTTAALMWGPSPVLRAAVTVTGGK